MSSDRPRDVLPSLVGAVERLPVAIFLVRVCDEGARVEFDNGAARALLGRQEPTLVGASPYELALAHFDAAFVERCRDALVRAGALRERGVLRRADGAFLHVEVAVDAIRESDGGACTHYFVKARDVTSEVDLLARAAERDRDVAVSAVAAGVAHEINNPLTYVLSNLELLRRAVTGDLVQSADDALEGAQRIRRVVQDLSALAQPSVGDATSDVHAAIGAALNLTRKTLHADAVASTELAAVPRARIDRHQLVQVLVLLLTNASQALVPGAPGSVHVTCALVDGRVVVRVTDNGEGIEPAFLPRVFEPFVTSRPAGGGRGLGLSICRRLVREAGGDIVITTAPGGGTTVTVTLDAAPARPVPVEGARPALAPRRARLLFVDDESRLCVLFRRLFERDHDVECLTSGGAALERLGAGAAYDAILCDLMMPGVSGRAVFEYIERSRPELTKRFVLVTGVTMGGELTEFAERAGVRVLVKPWEIDEIEGLVSDIAADVLAAAHPAP